MSPDRVSLSLHNSNSLWGQDTDEEDRRTHKHMGLLPKTAPEVFLIPLTVRETGAGGLGPTDAAAIQAPVHFWLVKAKHLHRNYASVNLSTKT